MLFIDLSHTSHTQARTGVQRVCRSLHGALANSAAACVALTHDPYLRAWRPLLSWERANLGSTVPGKKRGARWPWQARWRSRAARWLGRAQELPPGTGLVVPEIFSASVAAAFPALMAKVAGPRVAVFHDAIALKFPEITPRKTVARFPSYLRELTRFDGIAAVSEDSRATLLDYWRWAELQNTPPVISIPLGLDPVSPPSAQAEASAANIVVLSVGTLEGRKNHVALLDACDALWAEGARFDLHLVGMVHAETGREALALLRGLQAKGRPLRYSGPVDEASVEAAYAECTFTVYPSLMEGFGLPVLESLARGRPCVCSEQGALGESARGGGCLTVPRPDVGHLKTGIQRLLSDRAFLAGLQREATARRLRSWRDYVTDLTTWMDTLRRGLA